MVDNATSRIFVYGFFFFFFLVQPPSDEFFRFSLKISSLGVRRLCVNCALRSFRCAPPLPPNYWDRTAPKITHHRIRRAGLLLCPDGW